MPFPVDLFKGHGAFNPRVRVGEQAEGPQLASFYEKVHRERTADILSVEVHVSAADACSRGSSALNLDMSMDGSREKNRVFDHNEVPPIEWFFVELTNHCNYRCQWCPSREMKRDKGFMPFEKAGILLEEISTYRKRHPFLSMYAEIRNQVFLHVMGEPLLHPEVFEIIRYGHDLGLNFCLATNASLLDKARLHTLLDLEVQNVILSLNAPDAVHYEKTDAGIPYQNVIVQVQGLVRERYERGGVLPRVEIQLLNTRRVNLGDCSMVEDVGQAEENLSFWSSYVGEQERKADKPFCWSNSLSPLSWSTVLDGDTGDSDTYIQLDENLFLVFKRACNFANRLLPDDVKLREVTKGSCSLNNAHRIFCVLWDGSCTFCSLDYDNEVNLGNVFEHGIEAIWGGERMSKIRRSMEEGVLIEPLCRRCLGRLEGRDEIATARLVRNAGGLA